MIDRRDARTDARAGPRSGEGEPALWLVDENPAFRADLAGEVDRYVGRFVFRSTAAAD